MISSDDTKQQNSHAITMLYSGSPTEFSAQKLLITWEFGHQEGPLSYNSQMREFCTQQKLQRM